MPKTKANSRGYSLRKVDTREVRQRFLIVCEGAKTEPNYFRSFRVPKVVIEVRGLGENPSRLVESTKELKKQDDYDQIWCVFDVRLTY
jgi:RloB-like protein